MPRKIKKFTLAHFVKDIVIVVSLVLIWRGIWYALDEFDIVFMNGEHFLSAIVGIVAGLLILYIPDKDLKELERL